MTVLFNISCARPVNLPFIVPIAECSDRDGKGLPHRIQGILHHLGLVTNCKSGAEDQKETYNPEEAQSFKTKPGYRKKSLHSSFVVFETNSVRLYMYTAELKEGSVWILLYSTPFISNLYAHQPGFKPRTEKQNPDVNSRAILVTSIEDHEGVWLSKEVLFIQFVGTELHGGIILQRKNHSESKGHCKSVLLPLCPSCCLFIHAVCQDIKAVKHQIPGKMLTEF